METSKEELQSLNEELNAVNQRLEEKVGELEQASNDVSNLLTSGSIATVFLDKDLKVRRFTQAITRLLGLVEADMGRPIADIHRKFEDETLLSDARRVLVDLTPATAEVQADDGDWYTRRILPYRTKDDRIEGVVITFNDVTDLKELADALRCSEESVRQSEERHRLLSATMLQGVVHQDADGKIIAMNPAAERILGKSREQFLGSSSVQEERDTIRENGQPFPGLEHPAMVALRTGSPVHGVVMGVFNPQVRQYRWISIDAVPVCRHGESRPGEVYTVFEDITDRTQAEVTVQQERDRLAALVQSIHDEVWFADAAGQFTLVNPSGSSQFALGGTDPVDVRKLAESLEVLRPDGTSRPVEETPPLRALRGEVVTNQEELIRTPASGEFRYRQVSAAPVRDAQGNIIGSVSVVRDITERKRTEEALRESETKYRNLFNNMTEEVHFWKVVRDDNGAIKTWRLVDANPPTLKTWGKTLIEVQGKTTDEIFGPGATKHYMSVVQKIMGEGVPMAFEDYFPNLDKHFRFTSVPLGEYFITTGADITGIKKAQEALRASDQRFRLALCNAPVSVAVQDRDLRYVWNYNQRTAPSDGIIGKTDAEIFTPEETAHITVMKRRVLDEGIDLHEQMWLDRPSGRIFLDVFWEPIRDEAGKVIGVGSATVDLTPIKLAEETTRESEERLRLAQDVAGIGTWEWIPKSGKTTWSPELERIYGVAPGSLTDFQAWRKLVHPEDLARVEAETNAAIANRRRFDMQFRIIRPSGEVRWIATLGGAIYDDSGKVIRAFGVNMDITDRKRAEESLQAALDRFYSVLSSMTFAALLVDEDDRIDFANQAFCDIFNLKESPAELKGLTSPKMLEKIRPAYLNPETDLAHIRETVTRGVLVQDEEVPMQGGRTFLRDFIPIPLGDNKYGRLWLHKDITDRKRAEEALRQLNAGLEQRVAERTAELAKAVDDVRAERQQFYNVLETLPVYVVLLTEDYHVPFANRFFESRFGKSEGRKCYEYLFGRNEPCENCDTYKVMKTGQPHHWYWTGPDKRDYDIYDFPFTDTDGSKMILEMGIDITDRNKAAAALRELNETLERRVAERTTELTRSNDDLQQFAYVASHDLQEPLRMVSAFLKLLEERHKPQLDAKAQEYIGFAVDGATRMSDLIRDLLEYSRVRRQGHAFQPTDTGKVLHVAVANLRASIEETGATVTHDELPTVKGDALQLTQLLQNLIGNAIKFRDPKRPCQVHIGARLLPAEEVPGVSVQVSGTPASDAPSEASSVSASPRPRVSASLPCWLFSVRDNGIGIPPDQFDRVFVIFQRLHTREKYAGTGIGLSICKKIVERHGGRIWVESEPGAGSTFYFTISSGEEQAT